MIAIISLCLYVSESLFVVWAKLIVAVNTKETMLIIIILDFMLLILTVKVKILTFTVSFKN